MNELTFWKIVAKAQWGETVGLAAVSESPVDYDKCKEALREHLPTSELMTAFREIKRRRFNSLSHSLRATERTLGEMGLGDDGFDDLVHHIIGLGHMEFEANLADPTMAWTRGHNGMFVESFAYCIPHSEDYASEEDRHKRKVDSLKGRILQEKQYVAEKNREVMTALATILSLNKELKELEG